MVDVEYSPQDKTNFTRENWNYFSGHMIDFEKMMTQLSNFVTPEFSSYLRQNFHEFGRCISEGSDFQIELVLDTNVLYRHILGVMKKKETFVDKLLNSSFLKLYTPREIRDEIYQTIQADLPKKFNKDRAREIADSILNRTTVIADVRFSDWLKAQNLVGKKDSDDVCFCAIAFSMGTHGILTYDNQAYGGQDRIRMWKIGEVNQMVTHFRNGSMAFFLLGEGIPSIFRIVYQLVIAFLDNVIVLVHGLIQVGLALVKGGIDAFKCIPEELFVIGAIAFFSMFIFSEEFRNGTTDVMGKVVELGMTLLQKIMSFVDRVVSAIKDIIIALLPIVEIILNGVGYLILTVWNAVGDARYVTECRTI